jgi:hypothetical protein
MLGLFVPAIVTPLELVGAAMKVTKTDPVIDEVLWFGEVARICMRSASLYLFG